MSEIAFNNFGYAAKLNTKIDPFILSSRYFHQIDLKPLVLKHIIKRLDIKHSDIFFDIGCNVGTHLIPISFLCRKVYGNDHIDCLKTLKNNFQYIDSKCLIPGNFLKIKIRKKFNKILCYSVLHYLSNNIELKKFIFKASNLLHKKGLLYLGDIPILELERNFIKSVYGKKWFKKFNKKILSSKKNNTITSISDLINKRTKDNKLIEINLSTIKEILSQLTKKKFQCKILRHSKNEKYLFGPTRIDILIKKI
jgi:hypothetical protein